MLHPTKADNQTPVCWCRPPQIPTEQTLHNYKQCQTHSYPVASASQTHRERRSLTDSLETDSVCTQIYHLPQALCPWPRCVCLNTAAVGQTWQEVLIYSHFEIKEGEALTLNMTNEEGIDFLSPLETGPGCVSRPEHIGVRVFLSFGMCVDSCVLPTHIPHSSKTKLCKKKKVWGFFAI